MMKPTPTADGSIYTIPAVAIMFGRTRKAIYRLIDRFKSELSPTVYGQFRPSLRLHRLLSQHDVLILRRHITRTRRFRYAPTVKKNLAHRGNARVTLPNDQR